MHVVLRRRGLAPHFVPPISVVLAASKKRYVASLTGFRGQGVVEWIEHFAAATGRAARLAEAYLGAVSTLAERWRDRLGASDHAPRAGAAAWALIDVLPGHPVITASAAIAATGRARAAVYDAIETLATVGILIPLSTSRRNRAWEVRGLLDLVEGLEAGRLPV